MGKNYTVYIKYAEFGNEANKSGLLNELLDEHYRKVGVVTQNGLGRPVEAHTEVLGTKDVRVVETADWGA